MTFTVLGRPVTKKNSRRVFRNRRTGAMVLAQSAQECAWEVAAVLQLRAQWRRALRAAGTTTVAALADPVNMRALVYRDRDVGDLLNYLAAISDALEAAGVVQDDVLVLGVDGSRLLLDRERPRVEITLTPLVDSAAA